MVQRLALIASVVLSFTVIAASAGASGPGIDAESAAGWSAFGAYGGEFLGGYLAPAGDVNHDGTADVLVTATDAGGGQSGTDYARARAYVLFVRRDAAPLVHELADLDPNDGYPLFSDTNQTYVTSLANAGDVNGDGLADQALGFLDATNGQYSGQLRIVFGRAASDPIALDEPSPDVGYRFDGPNGSFAGAEVRAAGDVNGDDVPDQLVSAPKAGFSHDRAGAAWVVFGRRPAPTEPIDLETLPADAGYRIDGPEAKTALRAIDNAGDVNGDGIPDQLVGVPYAVSSVSPSEGRAYVVFGRKDGSGGPIALDALGSDGYAIAGDQLFGAAVANAGDVNGDGVPDQLVGSPTQFDTDLGRAHVVFGQRDSTTTIDSRSLTPAQGYVINDLQPGGGVGSWVRDAGDVNGDGVPDALLDDTGAPRGAAQNVGTAYVVFGRRAPAQGPIDLDSLTPATGYRIDGTTAGGELGGPINVGDVNLDGAADQLVGSPYLNDQTGAVFLVHAPALPALQAPAIRWDTRPASVLTCQRVARAFNASLSEQVTWLRDGVEITDAVGITHTIVAADVGHSITCRVRVSGVLGSVAAVSPPILVPLPAGPAPPAHRRHRPRPRAGPSQPRWCAHSSPPNVAPSAAVTAGWRSSSGSGAQPASVPPSRLGPPIG